jgi:hypothetical protein
MATARLIHKSVLTEGWYTRIVTIIRTVHLAGGVAAARTEAIVHGALPSKRLLT